MGDAIVLAGGVAKGAFGAGALATLTRYLDLDLRRIVAASSGALNGVFLAAAVRRGDAATALDVLEHVWIEHGTFGEAFDVSLRGLASLEGVSTNRKLLELLRRYVRPTAGGADVELRLVVTALAGATTREDGHAETTFERVLAFNGGAFDGGARFDFLLRAVTASAAFPLAFLPVSLPIDGGREVACYDGGLLNNAPLRHALDHPDVDRVFVIAPYPAEMEARPVDAHGLGLLAHLGDVLVNERLFRDLREARRVNRALLGLEAELGPKGRAAALGALGWKDRRVVDLVELRPEVPLEGNAFDGFFSRRLREAYVEAGRASARRWMTTIRSAGRFAEGERPTG